MGRRGLLILLGIGIFYVSSEMILTWVGLPEWSTPRSYPKQFLKTDNDEMIYVSLPSSKIIFTYSDNPRGYFRQDNTVVHTTNKLGFRGKDFTIAKPSGTFRVLFIGDSFTFGEGVRDEDTLPEQFARAAAESGYFGNKKIETVNLGVGGYNTRQELAVLQDFGPKLNPDLIVISYVINDAEAPLYMPVADGIMRRNREKEISETAVFLDEASWWVKIFKVHQYVWLAYRTHQRSQATESYYHSLYSENNLQWVKTKQAIMELGDYGRSNNIKIVSIVFPVLAGLDSSYPFEEERQMVVSEFHKAGIDTIDLFPELAGMKAEDLWVHPTDQHPNEAVFFRAAKLLLKSLLGQS